MNNSNQFERLSKSEMKHIAGGGKSVSCGACINAVGQWEGSCDDDIIAMYCRSGEGICWISDTGSC